MYLPRSVSVFIPTYNGRVDLERVLPRLFEQQVAFPFEVVCIDSSSSDGTWELLGRFPLRRERILQSEFNHGATRNKGIALCRGEIVVLLTQDALPLGREWLATIIANYADPDVAGVYCRQVARPDGTLLPQIDLRLAQNGRARRAENRLSDHPEYPALPPDARRELCNFDDICSSVRRSVWERFPFEPLRFAEDLAWGKQVFEAGFTLVYEPLAQVQHSHDRSFGYEFKRAFVSNKVLDDFFGRGDDKLRFMPAVLSLRHAPSNLVGVYSEFAREPWARRMRCYYVILARGLGRVFFNFWFRHFRGTRFGDWLVARLHSGV